MYRAEIDGLRAIAVVPVILFHAGVEVFSGGYVGVDVFFVISGYLITTIIVNELDRGDFSIARFYERRARRILPALLLVVAATLPFAWAWLTPSDMRDFAASIVGLATFSSNFVFWQQSGYFDTAAELKPLLHSWSLAVEEQFYILFPVFLSLVWRYGKQLLYPLLGLFFLSSLLLAEWAVGRYPDAAFFLLPTRGWELILGAFCALVLRRPGMEITGLGAHILSLAGLALIAFAVFTFDKTTPTPSLATFVPTLGTALVILAANIGTIPHRLLSMRPMVAIGLISYSAYLWHQPIIAFFRIRFGTELAPPDIVFCVALTFVLAAVSWRFVEQPFRRGFRIGTPRILALSFAALAGLSVVGATGYAMDGFRGRFDDTFLKIVDEGESRPHALDVIGSEGGSFDVAILGDSHANALLDALDAALRRDGVSAQVLTKNGCPPSLGLWRHDLPFHDDCDKHYAGVLDTLKATPSITTVIISARFALYVNSARFDNREGGVELGASSEVIYDDIAYRDEVRPLTERAPAVKNGIAAFVEALSGLGLDIYIITSIPEVGWDVPHIAGQRYLFGKTGELATGREVYDERVAPVEDLFTRLDAMSGVTLIDAGRPFCDDTRCVATENGIPLYHDSNHLNLRGATRLVEFLGEDAGLFR